MEVFTGEKRRVTLREPPIKAGGGEGAIYEVADAPGTVAKIYHSVSKAAARQAKIQRMIDIGRTPAFRQARLADSLAWPHDEFFDSKGRFIGYSMPLIKAVSDLDDLFAYPPRPGKTADTAQKLRTLRSLCAIYEKLHGLGLTVGDGNAQNTLVLPDNSAALVDLDSIHIDSTDRCVVCAPGYCAPELVKKLRDSGATYETCAGETFTQATDRFSLAVNIFRTLCHGAHPYYCRLTAGAGAGKTPSLDDRIVRGETPFFSTVQGADVPVYAPDLHAALPPYVLDLFRRAFLGAPESRPSPAEWGRALKRLGGELADCPKVPCHGYWKGGGGRCPYCEADARYLAIQTVGHRAAPRIAPPPAAPMTVVSTAASTSASFRPGAPLRRTVFGRLSAEVKFWFWTMIPAAAIVGFLGVPSMLSFYGRSTLGVILTVLHAGISLGATAYYDHQYAWRGRAYRWYKGVLSVLCAVGAMAGVVVAVAVAAGALGLAFAIAAAAGLVAIYICVMKFVWRCLCDLFGI